MMTKKASMPAPKKEEQPQTSLPAYGIFLNHPFMGTKHNRKRVKSDPIPMNFSCNTTEIGGQLYSSMLQSLLKVLERFDFAPITSRLGMHVDVKEYVKNHKSGPLRFYGIFTEIPMDLLEFCQQHKLMLRIHEWPTAEEDSNYRIHTFLPDESSTVFSSLSGIDKKGWINGKQFHAAMVTGKAPNDGYFAAHEKPMSEFKLSSW